MMIEVRKLFPRESLRTEVWVSRQAIREIERLLKRDRHSAMEILAKVRHYARAGFSRYTGQSGTPIKAEGGGVFRVGTPRHLFRLIGFFAGDDDREFICPEAFLKRGQKLGADERDRIESVRRIKQNRLWRKVESDESE